MKFLHAKEWFGCCKSCNRRMESLKYVIGIGWDLCCFASLDSVYFLNTTTQDIKKEIEDLQQ